MINKIAPEDAESTESTEKEIESLTPEYRVYRRRIYVLLVFSIYGLFLLAVFNTWAPVSTSAEIAFGWDITILALFPNLAMAAGLASLLPMIFILNKYGLRVATVQCTFLMMIGTGLRCIPYTNLCRAITCALCSIFSGYGLALSGVGFTMLSAVWFPPNERNKATAFTSICGGNVAAAMSFLLPMIMINEEYIKEYTNSNGTSIEAFNIVKQELENLLYLEFGAFAILFLTVLIYFPKEPPTPPSPTSKIDRNELKSGFLQLTKSKTLWLILMAYALPNGVRNTFVAIMDEALRPFGISQGTSNMIGVYMSLSAIPSGILFSGLADYKKSLMKPLLIICVFCAGVSYLFYALICYDIIPQTKAWFYAILIVGAFFTNGSVPLFFEYSCEICYPVCEEVVTGMLNGSMGVFAILALLLVMIKQFGTLWLAAMMPISFLIWVPFLIPLRPEFRRLNTDKTEETTLIEKSKG